MTAQPLVTVVIPNYNYGRYLRESIDSVLGQTYAAVEVIVVDDGSKDDSPDVLASYGDRIRWFRQQNGGVSRARNRGIQESRGELVAFLDADDKWRPEKLEKQVARLSDPRVGIVHCGVEYIDKEGRSLGINVEGSEGEILTKHALLRTPTILAGGSSALVRKVCFEKLGAFDPQLSTSADWDMWRRIACHYQVAEVPDPLLLYRMHGTAMHRNLAVFERDMLHAFDRMFADPDAQSVWPLKRDCYANLYVTFCGSFLHARNWSKAAEYAWKSVQQRPDRLARHVAGAPLRRLRRLLKPREGYVG